MLTSDTIRAQLGQHRDSLTALGVRNLWVFGSVARGEESAHDLDVLVEFVSPPGFLNFMNLKFMLEEMFEIRVDLHSLGSCPQRFYQTIEKDLLHVA